MDAAILGNSYLETYCLVMSDTQLKAINFTPGVVKDSTEYMAEGGWVDCDKIRFRGGKPEKLVGG